MPLPKKYPNGNPGYRPGSTPGTAEYANRTRDMEKKLANMRSPMSNASKKEINALEKEIRKRGGNTKVSYKGRLISGKPPGSGSGNKGK